MQFTNVLSAVALLAASCSAVPHSKRAQATTDVTLYAYGTNISGLPILYGNADGLAYIGDSASGNSTSALSWDISTSGDVAWNATVVNGTSGGAFYITNGGDTNDQAGFATANTTLATNATTTGFSLFGGQVIFISGDSYLSQFWATEESTGLWSLTWNSAGTSLDNSVPVTVKTMAPSSATSDSTASTS